MQLFTPLLAFVALLGPAVLLPAQSNKGLYDPGTLRTLNLSFSSSSWYSTLVANRSTGAWLSGNLVVDGQLYQQVGVRISGRNWYSGTPSQKKSLSISMNQFVPAQQLLGHKNINLRNGFNDPTMLREVLGYQILRDYMPAPKANWVKVYINNVYWGLYSNMQQIDKDMIDEWFKGNDGNRYHAEETVASGKGKSALQYLGTSLQNYKDAYDLRNPVATAIKPWEDVRKVSDVLANSTQLTVDLPQVLDVDQALWYLAYYSICANLNGYNTSGTDYYLYHDEQYDLVTVLPWDMAGAFGASSNQTVKQAIEQPPFLDESKTNRPLLGKLWGVPEWRARYIRHMRTILDDSFNWAKVSALVTTHTKLIDAALKADTQKLYSYQNAIDNVTKQVAINSGTYAKIVPGLRQLCDGRNLYLRNLAEFKGVAPTITNVTVTPVNPKPNTVVVITAKVTNTVAMGPVTLFYRSQRGYVSTQMFDDGKHGDGAANDGVYGGVVPNTAHTPGAVVQYFVGAKSASSAGGAASYLPKTAAADPSFYVTQWAIGQSPVSINEVMSDNTKTIKDSAGEFDDWLELYNESSRAVTVGGMYLTDKVANSTKWQIPANTTVPANGTILIWCDEDAAQGALHANFKLSATNGEDVFLFDTDGKTQLSKLTFGPMDADVSNGWLQDGKETTLVAYKTWGNNFGRGATPDSRNEPVASDRQYWPLDYQEHRQFLQWVGGGKIGTTNAIRGLGGPSSGTVLLFIATAPGVVPIGNGLHLMLGGVLSGPYPLPTDSTGQCIAVIKVPADQSLVGQSAFLQTGGTDTKGFTVSNGAEVEFSK